MEYKVGQILYMTNTKNLKIIPVQVIEEVTRTTLSGIEKTYMVQFPDSKKTIADISSLKGDFFQDVETLRTVMIQNATNSINKMITVANVLAKEEYNFHEEVSEEKNIVQNDNSVQVETNNDIILVDLGNGVKAKMNTKELDKVANQ